MLPITTTVHEAVLVQALHRQGRAHVLAFARLLARYADDAAFTEELVVALASDAAEARELTPGGRRPRRR